MQNLTLLQKALLECGEGREEVFEGLKSFAHLLYRWSAKLNLLSQMDRDQIVEKHLLPSLRFFTMLRMVPNSCVIDFGSGAGLPGIPLKILMPNSSFVLVESRRRRANYLKQIVRSLKLEKIEIVHGRLESISSKELQADVVVSRAVMSQSALVSVVGPYIRPAGVLVCTSPTETEEVSVPKLVRVGEQPQIHMI